MIQGEARRTLKMAAAAGRGSSILRALWAFVVLGALLVTLPLLAIWSLFAVGLAAADIGEWTVARLLALLWPVAGVAGVVGLILAKTRGPLDARAIRIRQALLLAGIAAAAPLSVGSIAAGLADPQPDSVIALAFAAPFTVLILEGVRDISSLQALLAGSSEPMRISAAFLWLALICVVGAAAGHLAL